VLERISRLPVGRPRTHPDAVVGDKAELYRALGLTLTYDVSTHEIRVEMRLDPDHRPQNRGVSVGVRRGT
jgi:hypothetical protein